MSELGVQQPTREKPGGGGNGYFMLVALLVVVVAGALGVMSSAAGNPDAIKLTLFAAFAFVFIMPGFYMLQPNEAAAITLFGAYRGTDRNHGLRWIWPWMGKQKISVRANNLISQTIKVNDQRGNPIEIAAQVVWRVTDTAQALFDVDDYMDFVAAQIEAAVRTIGSRYPYDDIEHQEVTLRGNHDLISGELRTELIEPARRSPASRSTNAASPTSPMPPKSPARCCAGSRPKRWSRRARRWSTARSAWSKWRSPCSARRRSSSWMTNAAPRWCRT